MIDNMTTNQSSIQTKKRPCKVTTMKEKMAILKELEAGTSRGEVELQFKCAQSTISRLLAGKKVIIQDAEGNVTSKRDNLLNYKQLDQALSRWAKEMKSTDCMITSNMAKQKAEELSSAMGHDLKPSSSWLYKWKERENIKFTKRSKDTQDILKEFLCQKEKSEEIQRIIGDNYKNFKADTEQIIFNNMENTERVSDNTKNLRLQRNLSDHEHKPRSKRDYVKRLDASGMICRSRKEKTFLTLLQKLKILQRLKKGERRPNLIIEYNLSHSAMSQIVTDEKKILKLVAGGQNLHMKRIRGGIFKDGEAELNSWIREKMEYGESLTRTQIKNRAKEIARRLNIDFKASTGWLEKWKTRMNLDFNENQKLQRKIPNYLTTDEECENLHAQFENSESFYDQDTEMLENQIKAEYIDDGVEINDVFICNDINSADVKTELMAPQEFYLQNLQDDKQISYICNDTQKRLKKQQPPVEFDVKPFIDTVSLSSQSEEVFMSKEAFQEQVLNWLNRYNVPSVPASELLSILHPHLDVVTKNSSNTV